MRWVLSRHIPPFRRIAIVESGSREIIERLLPGLYERFGPELQVDLVTCYVGLPAGFLPARGQVFRTADYGGGPGRDRLLADVRARQHDMLGILCSAEPIMTKWKWLLALRVPAKLFIINENADFFWADRAHLKVLGRLLLYRAGLTGAGAAGAIGRLCLFPFTVAYLLLFAAVVHLRRSVRA